MSVDTSHASPTSPPSDASTPSAWDALRLQITTEWAIKAAAGRREFGPTRPLAPWELRRWIARYEDWLATEYVQTRGALKDWVTAQRANAVRQLTALTSRSTR